MQKNIESALFKSLLKSDFLVFKNGKTVSHLDAVSTLKSLKQFIRLIQFISNSKDKSLLIDIHNTQLNSILTNFNKKYPINLNIESNDSKKVSFTSKDAELLLLFDSLKYDQIALSKKLLRNKNYLVQRLNNKFELNSIFTYKILNNLDDFKKLIFLLSIIRQVANKNKKWEK
jgi:hypothetical protein